jgi:hypothetical protein
VKLDHFKVLLLHDKREAGNLPTLPYFQHLNDAFPLRALDYVFLTHREERNSLNLPPYLHIHSFIHSIVFYCTISSIHPSAARLDRFILPNLFKSSPYLLPLTHPTSPKNTPLSSSFLLPTTTTTTEELSRTEHGVLLPSSTSRRTFHVNTSRL